ncbi:YciI family protein [Risungbinella massiliensis]|uniref:YciI family protein n=1 Tax=Risungbinella massiliensis TaxID=1329796 RepID=UPI0005CBFEDB|nr:YciI family protein [Risungbinella massiliensis]
MFLAILNYKVPLTEVDRHVQDHRDYLDTLYAKGKLIVSGPQEPKTGGVILFAVSSQAEVDEMIANDPYFVRGIATYQVIQFHPVKSDGRFRELYLEK